MRKFLALAVLAASIIVCSCEQDIKNDITVVNNCSFPVGVNVTKSAVNTAYPVALPSGGSYKFKSLDNDNYYIHVQRTSDPTEHFYNTTAWTVYRNETWAISWNGTAYVITTTS